MQTINIVLIAKRENSNEWKNTGEFALPALPRAGEYVVLNNGTDLPLAMYRVVSVFHAAPFQGLTEVFAVYAGGVGDVQDQLLSS